MKTCGSNYNIIGGDMNNPVVGTYHLFPDTVESNLRDMYEHGQRKVSVLIWYAPLNFPAATDHRYHHVIDSYGGAMFEGHKENLVNLIALAQQIGFQAVHVRFGAQGDASLQTWTGWSGSQYTENSRFIRDVISAVNASRGDFPVMFDLGVEQAGDDWLTSKVKVLYCMHLWRDYLASGFDPAVSCGFSILHGAGGLRPMLARFTREGLALPGCYSFDTYGYEAQALTAIYALLQEYSEAGKVIYLGETFYNDAQVASEVRNVLAANPQINFGGIFQWAKVRGAADGDFPDVYPKRYDNYLVE